MCTTLGSRRDPIVTKEAEPTKTLQCVVDMDISFLIDIGSCGVICDDSSQARLARWEKE